MISRQMTNSFEEDVVDLIPALNSFARTFYSSPSDVEDLVQETLTRALGNIDRFCPGSNLKSWLFTIMRTCFAPVFASASARWWAWTNAYQILEAPPPSRSGEYHCAPGTVKSRVNRARQRIADECGTIA